MRIVYFGTPDFAVPPLETLASSQNEIVAVVTGPDKKSGRGGSLLPTPVRAAANELGLEVLTVDSLRDPTLSDRLKAYDADLFVVIAYRILPATIFRIPSYGSLNVHASLLPKYRGAAPIQWAILNGETETGLTSFLLNEQVDTGVMIHQARYPIAPNETYDELHDRLSGAAGEFLVASLDLLQTPGFTPLPQSDQEATRAPKLHAADAFIDFGLPAARVHDFVRGLSSRPGSWTTWRGKKLKILRSACTDIAATGEPGSLIVRGEELFVTCADRLLSLMLVVPEGRKSMSGDEFLRGFRLTTGERLGLPPDR